MAYNGWTKNEIEAYLAKRNLHGFLDVLYNFEKVSIGNTERKAECLERTMRILGREADVVAAKSNLKGKPDALTSIENAYVKYLLS